MKSLKPSHREKKRYLLLEGNTDEKTIEKTILDYIGILGYAKASPKIVKKGKKAILAINRKELDKVRAAFLLSGKKIKIVKVSGSLKKLK
jgi:RNase P/RNase MRP subunit POP5